MERSKQFADLRAQVKCLTCAHQHHERKKINSMPVRCSKPETNEGRNFRCPCYECTCQFCVLEDLKRLKGRNTFFVKTLEDVEGELCHLINRYPKEPALVEVRKTIRVLLAGEEKK